jgi:hypothetical protein
MFLLEPLACFLRKIAEHDPNFRVGSARETLFPDAVAFWIVGVDLALRRPQPRKRLLGRLSRRPKG